MNNQMIYDKINARILDSLTEGVAPWRKPWTSKLPVNAVSGKQYRGINLWLLTVDSYGDNRWVTFKQALDLGGSVSAGQKGSTIVFWTKTTFGNKAADNDGDETVKNGREVPVLRHYTVFNVEQCHGLKLPAIDAGRDNALLSTPEQIVAAMPNAPRREASQVAAYSPARDTVLMPPMASFQSSESFYSVLFHELVHSTGSPKRLGRFDLTEPMAAFGSEDYSREELTA